MPGPLAYGPSSTKAILSLSFIHEDIDKDDTSFIKCLKNVHFADYDGMLVCQKKVSKLRGEFSQSRSMEGFTEGFSMPCRNLNMEIPTSKIRC